MMLSSVSRIFVSFVVLILPVSSLVLPRATNLTVHPIYRSPTNHQFENLAVRANGLILATTSGPTAQLYQIDPFNPHVAPTLVESFPHASSALGITELEPDIFYVAVCNFTITPKVAGVPGSAFVYRIDMSSFISFSNGHVHHRAAVRKVASVPKAGVLNGMTSISRNDDFVLVADSFLGLIWKVDVTTGVVSPSIQVNQLAIPPNATLPLGVNGIKVQNGYLYFTNSGLGSFFKIPINPDGTGVTVNNGTANGTIAAPTLIASNIAIDDFILDKNGNAYLAGQTDVLLKVTPTGVPSRIAGSSGSNNTRLLLSPTAVEFGRTSFDRSSVYITTNGGILNPVVGSQGISRVDIGALPLVYLG